MTTSRGNNNTGNQLCFIIEQLRNIFDIVVFPPCYKPHIHMKTDYIGSLNAYYYTTFSSATKHPTEHAE